MSGYRKTWDKDEYSQKAKDRLVAEDGKSLSILFTVRYIYIYDVITLDHINNSLKGSKVGAGFLSDDRHL